MDISYIFKNIISSFGSRLLKAEYKLGLIADYVVEYGTSGIWTYRKWASGIAECWGVITTTITHWDAWSGLYEGKPVSKASFPTGLFIDTPVITATMDSKGQGLITTEVYLSASKDGTQEFYPVRPSAGQTNKELLVSVMAKGLWKNMGGGN